MAIIRNRITVLFLALFFIIGFSPVFGRPGRPAAPKNSIDISSITSYRDIPGITNKEISAVEELIASRTEFIYGSMPSTEAFLLDDGTFTGFTKMFCALLTELFGIPFIPELHTWKALKDGIDAKTIDFTGEMTPTPQRELIYYMTYPIAERGLGVFTRGNFTKIELIDLKGLKIGFYKGTITANSILTAYPELNFEIVDVHNDGDVNEKLSAGEIDVFIADATEALTYGGRFISHQNVFPIIHTPVSLTTANPELKPLISAVNKYIAAGGIDKLTGFYKAGNNEYAKFEFYKLLTDGEISYLNGLSANNAKVPVALENDNYPICFYDKNEKGFRGITLDVLSEITLLTGIEFENIAKPNETWAAIMNMLESGEAAIVSELLFTEERKGKFIWSGSNYAVNRYALISKSDYPYLEMYQVVRASVGVMKRSAREDVYSALFPKNDNVKLYDYSNEVFTALESGEIDMMMSSEYEFLTLTNFLNKTGYKVNIMFSSPLVESFFGFNKNEEMLKSLISKSLNYINTARIEKDWVSRHFNYEMKMAEDRARYANQRFVTLIILVAVILMFLVTTILLLVKNNVASAKIKRANERLTLMLDTSPICAQIWSRNLNTIDCNEAAVKLYGFKDKLEYKEKFLTCCSPEYQPDGERSGEKAVTLVNKAFEEGYCSFDWLHKMPYDNTPVPADVTLVRAKYIDDDVVVGYTRDMREHSKLMEKIEFREKLLEVNNAKLQKALEQVSAASKAKGDFLSNMSHEMRTPMNAIAGMTLIGKKAQNIEEKNHALNKIGEASSHLIGVINDVLDMAKIEAGKLELSPVEYNFEGMLKKTAGIIHFRADEKRQTLTVDIDKKIPRFVMGDDQRLAQAITNLLANAVKFTPEEGEINLGVSLVSEMDGYCELRVEVTDSGIGIAPEKQEKLFRAFEQAERETSREYGGTGLGLIITKNIVEIMGGRIWVESSPGKGAKFIFTVQVEAGEKNEDSAGTADYECEIDDGAFEGKHLLVVEDFKINREILILFLKGSGLVIDCAENGKEALDIITASPDKYDIVFMDLQMPVMGGFEATRLIRALPARRKERLPIVAMTANVFKDDIEACIAAGMDGHIGKPLDIDRIKEVLRKYLIESAVHV